MKHYRRAAVAAVGVVLAGLLAVPARHAESTNPPVPVVMAVGDSISTGYNLQWPVQSWPDRLFTREFAQDRVRTSVVAHGGQCLVATICAYGPPLVDTWDGDVLDAPTKPSTVVLLIGRNDLAHVTDDEFMTALHELVDSAAACGIRVLVGTILPSTSTYQWASYTEPQRRRINDRIRADFAPFVFDGAASIGDSLDGIYAGVDGVHPAWPAHVVIADSVPLWWIT